MNGRSSSAKSSPASKWASSSNRSSRSSRKRTGQPAGKLFQRGVEFRGAGGVDHSQHGLGLGQVDASGEELRGA